MGEPWIKGPVALSTAVWPKKAEEGRFFFVVPNRVQTKQVALSSHPVRGMDPAVLNARHSMPTLHDTQKQTQQRDGGGLQPTAINPDYWDLVPHSDIHQQHGSRDGV